MTISFFIGCGSCIQDTKHFFPMIGKTKKMVRTASMSWLLHAIHLLVACAHLPLAFFFWPLSLRPRCHACSLFFWHNNKQLEPSKSIIPKHFFSHSQLVKSRRRSRQFVETCTKLSFFWGIGAIGNRRAWIVSYFKLLVFVWVSTGRKNIFFGGPQGAFQWGGRIFGIKHCKKTMIFSWFFFQNLDVSVCMYKDCSLFSLSGNILFENCGNLTRVEQQEHVEKLKKHADEMLNYLKHYHFRYCI